eukprot:1800227-Amphidinium_carterae.1
MFIPVSSHSNALSFPTTRALLLLKKSLMTHPFLLLLEACLPVEGTVCDHYDGGEASLVWAR